MTSLIQDLRYACRQMGRSPGFTAIAILTLAIGVGGVSTVFSVVNSVVLRPLPFGEPDRLVRVVVRRAAIPVGSTPSSFGSPPPAEDDWHVRQRAFEDVVRYLSNSVTLVGDDAPVRVFAPAVPDRFTQLLQVRPWIGRSFAPDDVADPPSVALVSYRFWQDRLSGDPEAVGTSLRTDVGALTVVGVMPEEFTFYSPGQGEPTDIWVPGEEPERGGIALARLRPGISPAAAEADLNRVLRELSDAYPGSAEREAELIPLIDDAVGAEWRRVLLTFFGAVGFVFLIAVTNVANLTLARGIGRERELGIRAAIGATRARLVRQMLVENTALSMLGAIAGLILTGIGLRLILSALPAGFPRVGEIRIDATVLVFSLVTALVAGVLFGLAPAFGWREPTLDRVMRDAGSRSTEGGWRRRARSVLVAGEVALAAVLLTGALLLTQSFVNLVGTPLGMTDLRNVVVVRPMVPASRYDPAARRAFYSTLSERLLGRPDVTAVSVSNVSGMTVGFRSGLEINGRQAQTFDEATPYITASPAFFDVLGVEVAEGRVFREGEETAVVVTESFAERHYPGRSAIGQVIGGGPAGSRTIVGVARDFRIDGPVEEPTPAVIATEDRFQTALLVRIEGDPIAVMEAAREEVRVMDPMVVVDQTTLDDAYYALDAVSQPRLRTAVFGVFSVVALVLALVGIAGVVSWSAARRVQEVGVRMALGGTRLRIVTTMLAQAMIPVVAGVAVGIMGAAGLSRTISAYLFEVSPLDPAILLATPLLLLAASAIAAWLPIRRSTAIHPMDALRYE